MSKGEIADNRGVRSRRRSLIRIYATPAAVVAMGALWMWNDLGAMRGAIVFCAGVTVLSVILGVRSDRKTRRRLEETERQLGVLRTRGLHALRQDLDARSDTKKDAA